MRNSEKAARQTGYSEDDAFFFEGALAVYTITVDKGISSAGYGLAAGVISVFWGALKPLGYV